MMRRARAIASGDAVPCPYEVRVGDGGRPLGVSNAARWAVTPDGPVVLIPRDDLTPHLDELVAGGGTGEVDGYVAVDHERFDVELVDAPTRGDGRDVTVKRFPVWGTASDLIALLDVRPLGGRRYESALRPGRGRSIVEASQLLAQAIVAASREVPGRRVVSASMTFSSIVHDSVPYAVELDTVYCGRTFASFVAHVVQEGRRCASGILLLGVPAPDTMRHAVESPPVAGPYDSGPVDMAVLGRDLRVVDDAYTNDSAAPVGPPVIDAWLRYHDVPDDQPLHAALLAQFTGHMSIAASMRPHAGIGQDQAHRTLSTAPLAIGLSFHADVRADEWMRFRHLSTFAGDGMTHSECRVHDLGGRLVASFTVDAMVRAFASKRAIDPEAAL